VPIAAALFPEPRRKRRAQRRTHEPRASLVDAAHGESADTPLPEREQPSRCAFIGGLKTPQLSAVTRVEAVRAPDVAQTSLSLEAGVLGR